LPEAPPPPSSPRGLALAWGVHLLTASGVVCALAALEAAAGRDWRAAFLWLFAAGIVDAVDGTLARAADVKRRLPGFDGALLDNVVDYVTYALVPAWILHASARVPGGLLLPALVCLASAYQFCRADAKTEDHYFTGFPSYWNVAVLYLHLFDAGPITSTATLGALLVLVFVPVRYVYPSRTPTARGLTLTLSATWALLMLGLLLAEFPPPPALLGASLAFPAYYLVSSLVLTARRRRSL
jgi:phosphatidylcholine synthase